MSTIPSPLAQQQPSKGPSLKAPAILFVLLLIAGDMGIRWLHSRAQTSHPILRQTKSGWQQLPAPSGLPEKLLVTSNGTVWVLTWGQTGLSRWDGSKWQYYKETNTPTKTSRYGANNVAADGDRVWASTEQYALYWDGQRWYSYRDAAASQGASIAAGAGQAWIVDGTGKFSHFEDGKWTSRKLTLPGVVWENSRTTGNPALARTTDGTVWLVLHKVWRLDGANFVEATADGKPIEGVDLIGAAGDRLWLSDSDGMRAVSMHGSNVVYAAEQTGLDEEAMIDDVASDGRLTWFAASTGLVEFDGSHWKRLPRPSQQAQGVHAIAAAPDGTLWAVGFTPGGLFGQLRYLPYLMALMSVGLIGASIWFFRRVRARQLQQHRRVTKAVQHATGEVPAELEVGERQLAGAASGWLWVIYIFGGSVGFFLMRRFWPQAPYWMLPVLIVAIHLAITFQQSLVKRKPMASDPIGPGAPSQYDWGKTLKSVGGGLFLILIFNAGRFPALRFLRGWTVWAVLAAWIGYKALGQRLMNQAIRRADYEGALNINRWFHFYNPSGSEAMRSAGHVLVMAGRYREAEDALRRSFTSSHAAQTYGMALEYLGDALMEQGRYDEATRCFEAALHTFSWLRRPYRGMAEMLLRRGQDSQQAVQYVERIIDFEGLSKLERQNNGRPQDDYWALRAWALASIGRSSEVAQAIEKALKATDPNCKPDLATTHYRVGMAMQALGNMPEANEHFRRAIEFDPHGRRGMLAAAAMRETGVWSPVRV